MLRGGGVARVHPNRYERPDVLQYPSVEETPSKDLEHPRGEGVNSNFAEEFQEGKGLGKWATTTKTEVVAATILVCW